MRKSPIVLILIAVVSMASSLLAQSSVPSRAIFVLPTLTPDPTVLVPASAQPGLQPDPYGVRAFEANAPALSDTTDPSPSLALGANRRSQPEISPALRACRQRYTAAVYNIGLALWTAPPIQHRALERLLNAATAVQSVALDPATVTTGTPFCSDASLSTLESAVVRLKSKGWVPMTPVEEHVVHSASVSDELKRALAALWR